MGFSGVFCVLCTSRYAEAKKEIVLQEIFAVIAEDMFLMKLSRYCSFI